jgi:hypothetical protein
LEKSEKCFWLLRKFRVSKFVGYFVQQEHLDGMLFLKKLKLIFLDKTTRAQFISIGEPIKSKVVDCLINYAYILEDVFEVWN